MPGGRTLNPLWIVFIRNDTNPRNVKANCKKCGTVIHSMIERMKKHARTCENVKVEDEDETPVKKSKLDSMVVKTITSEAYEMDKQIARCILSTNTPFHFVEAKHFKRMCEMLRPGYKPPSERSISGELLEDIFKEEQEKSQSDLEGKTYIYITI